MRVLLACPIEFGAEDRAAGGRGGRRMELKLPIKSFFRQGPDAGACDGGASSEKLETSITMEEREKNQYLSGARSEEFSICYLPLYLYEVRLPYGVRQGIFPGPKFPPRTARKSRKRGRYRYSEVPLVGGSQ